MVDQLCEYTKIVHFKKVSFIICEIYHNKLIKKKNC